MKENNTKAVADLETMSGVNVGIRIPISDWREDQMPVPIKHNNPMWRRPAPRIRRYVFEDRIMRLQVATR